jgi:exopolyphosphatase/guanosine-5'-triphosphate,3'-diphosphate pyrophosphatase
MDAALDTMDGFRRIMAGYAVQRVRAVATAAVREAANRDTFLDRVRLRTGLEVEVIDGSEENRLTYLAVQQVLEETDLLRDGSAALVEIGGGSADISLLRSDGPVVSGTYPIGAIRIQQNLAHWHGGHEARVRLLERRIESVIDEIRREIPLNEARTFLALGGDVRFAATRIIAEPPDDERVRSISKADFLAFCDQVVARDTDELVDEFRLSMADAETLAPALLAYRRLLSETTAENVVVLEASLRMGLVLDLALQGEGRGIEEFRRQVLSSAASLGQKYSYDEPHAKNVAHLAVRLFDQLEPEHGLTRRDRLVLEVAALLHDIGLYVGIRAHHKHAQYILSVSEVFGLTREDMAVVSNVARYHRRAFPQKAHLPFMALDRETRIAVSKLAAILRVANALDADHLQKVRDVTIERGPDAWTLEVDGAGDLTLERLVTAARSDLFHEVFGRKLQFREPGDRG